MTEIVERPDGADDSQSGTATASDLEGGSGLYADVSRATVRLYKEQFGRGRRWARTPACGT